ncbi:MAG: hypothetical protein IKP58_02835 [Victivallales bacterium]|nr:hypothetical protein [Victivallales bacterium]
MQNKLLTILICFCLAATLSAQKQPEKKSKSENLIKNGNLEKGDDGKTPKHWAKFDGLTVRWEKSGGNPGHFLLLDTSVLKSDKKLMDENAEAFEKKGRSQKEGHYDTVGASQGAWAFAAPIDVKPSDAYFILSADVSASKPSSEMEYPMVLIRGFKKITAETAGQNKSWFHEHFNDGVGYSDVFGSKDLYRDSREGDYLQVYRKSLFCRNPQINQWRHFEVGFKLPTINKFRPDRILIKPYAFWPPGHYCFDNLSLRRATKAEVDAVNAKIPSIKEVLK